MTRSFIPIQHLLLCEEIKALGESDLTRLARDGKTQVPEWVKTTASNSEWINAIIAVGRMRLSDSPMKSFVQQPVVRAQQLYRFIY
ncbi:hypothetical protein E2C01_001835 [Portunus trituberculatus]|uniref:Uncharacterized protein n=1 Tax=Portunus trituberculatus TaxID=210409 RepID=A0A5B7CHQ0_PORTR|nr:hypothetical protein [Portunus trituberculatus]